MMAAVLVLCLVAFFIVVSSVAYASIFVSTCAACVGFVRARLPNESRVNPPYFAVSAASFMASRRAVRMNSMNGELSPSLSVSDSTR